MLLIVAGMLAPKWNRVKYGNGSLGHKIKTLTLHAVVHSGWQQLVVRGLTCNIAESFGKEIGT